MTNEHSREPLSLLQVPKIDAYASIFGNGHDGNPEAGLESRLYAVLAVGLRTKMWGRLPACRLTGILAPSFGLQDAARTGRQDVCPTFPDTPQAIIRAPARSSSGYLAPRWYP